MQGQDPTREARPRPLMTHSQGRVDMEVPVPTEVAPPVRTMAPEERTAQAELMAQGLDTAVQEARRRGRRVLTAPTQRRRAAGVATRAARCPAV